MTGLNKLIRIRPSLLAIVLLAGLQPATARALEVFACEPEWGSLVAALTGGHANVTVATTAFQDPHRLQARPSLIARARTADFLICTGAELETGWLPLLLRRAGNRAIQTGAEGHFLAAEQVRRIEIPVRIDRAEGDVHPQGNPHVHMNPHNISRIARKLGERLQQLDPAQAEGYQQNTAAFLERWEEMIEIWEQRAEPLRGLRLVAHHRSFSYLADWLDLSVVATLEKKPGIPPSGAHLAQLLEQLSAAPPAAIVRTPYDNERPSNWLAGRLAVTDQLLPYTVGGTPDAPDLFSLFEATLTRLESLSQ
jgi:zinc/manganese transport system substrate-binding protein